MKANREQWVRRGLIALAAAGVLGSASPLYAATAEYDGGARATTNSEDTVVTVTDIGWDNYSAYSNFYVHGDNSIHRVETTGGKNTSASSGTFKEGIEKLRACENRPLVPDGCSSYVYT